MIAMGIRISKEEAMGKSREEIIELIKEKNRQERSKFMQQYKVGDCIRVEDKRHKSICIGRIREIIEGGISINQIYGGSVTPRLIQWQDIGKIERVGDTEYESKVHGIENIRDMKAKHCIVEYRCDELTGYIRRVLSDAVLFEADNGRRICMSALDIKSIEEI